MSHKVIQIQWTASHLEEATYIAKELVLQKLVACANLLPHVQSIYLWEGKLERSSEVKVLLKTKKELFEKVCEYIVKHSSYDVPEVSMFTIEDGNASYLDWVCKTVGH